MKRVITIPVIVFSFLMFAGTVNAQKHELLKGVSTTSVLIEDLSSAAQSAGLDVEQLQTDVELRFRKAGIRLEKKATSYFYVRVSAVKAAPCEGYAVAVSVEFDRGGALEFVKGSSVVDVATVWSEGILAATSTKDFREKTRQILADLCDKFLNDFLAANPKP